MKLETMLLCESVEVLPSGKINLIGAGINRISAVKFPVKVDCFLFLRFVIRPSEMIDWTHSIILRLRDEDGQQVIPDIRLVVNLVKPKEPVRGIAYLNSVGEMKNIVFPKDGDYELEIILDGNEVGTIPIFVVREVSKEKGNNIGS